MPWALTPSAWVNEMEYRFWMVPMSLVVMGGCALDVWIGPEVESCRGRRQPTLIAIGIVFLTVLSIQSLTWKRLSNRLMSEMQDPGCIPRASLTWVPETPLNHWSVASYAIILQGSRAPRTLVLDGDGCYEYATDATVQIKWLHRHNGDGWFDLSQVPVTLHPPWKR